MTHLPRSRVLVFLLCFVGSLAAVGAGSPAGALSCIRLPDDLLEGVASGEPPDFWGDPAFVTSAVVARVVDRAPDPVDGLRDDGAWLGTVEVDYAIGLESIDERVDVRAGSGSSDWGTDSLPPVGDLIAIFESRAVGDPEPTGLSLGICPNSVAIDEDRAAAALALAADSGVLVAEPGSTTPTTTTPTTTTTTTATTTTTPTTTTAAPPPTAPVDSMPDPDPSADDGSATGWIIGAIVAVVAATVVASAVRRSRC